MSPSTLTAILIAVAFLSYHIAACDVDDPPPANAGPPSDPTGWRPHMISPRLLRSNLDDPCSPYPPEPPVCVISNEPDVCECGTPCNRGYAGYSGYPSYRGYQGYRRRRRHHPHRPVAEEPPCPCGLGLPPSVTNCDCVSPKKDSYLPVVQKLKDKLDRDSDINAAFIEAIKQLNALNVATAQCITSVDDYLSFADQILKTPPYQSGDTRNVYDILATFYLVVDLPALQPFQSAVQPGTTQGGKTQQQLSFLSEWLRDFSMAWGDYLDNKNSTECVLSFKDDSWYCWNDFKLPDGDEPDGGFMTYNQYFSRHLCNEDVIRPVNCSDERHAVVFPADSTFVASYKISSNHKIETESLCAKGAVWSIRELLFRSHYRNMFAGGVLAHAFLSTYNYHRWHTPVAGKIVERRVISGQFYLNVSTIEYEGDVLPYIRDDTGYQFLQQRGLVVIDTTGYANVGYVAALPIGMAQVSSVKFTVQVGDVVKKGDELGTFLFGGSDFVVVFEKQAHFHVMAERNKQSYVRQLYGWLGTPPDSTPKCAQPPPPPDVTAKAMPVT